jgi:hypothetical protein
VNHGGRGALPFVTPVADGAKNPFKPAAGAASPPLLFTGDNAMKRSTLAYVAAGFGIVFVMAEATDAFAERVRAGGSRSVSAVRGPNGGVAVHSRTSVAGARGYSGGGYHNGGRVVAGVAVGAAAANRANYNCSYYHTC